MSLGRPDLWGVIRAPVQAQSARLGGDDGRAGCTARDRGFADSPLERDGFEPSVPLGRAVLERSNKPSRRVGGYSSRGTEGSNPSPSSNESAANLIGAAKARGLAY